MTQMRDMLLYEVEVGQLFLLDTIICVYFWQNLRCGTTGVVTFLRGQTLHVAWLGDSQVILVRRGQVVELMKPHKPDREVTAHIANNISSKRFYFLKVEVQHFGDIIIYLLSFWPKSQIKELIPLSYLSCVI